MGIACAPEEGRRLAALWRCSTDVQPKCNDNGVGPGSVEAAGFLEHPTTAIEHVSTTSAAQRAQQ